MSDFDNTPGETTETVQTWIKKNKNHLKWFAPAVGFIFGYIITSHILGSFFFAAFMLIVAVNIEEVVYARLGIGNNTYGRPDAFESALVAMIAAVIKADGNISRDQIEIVERKLKKEYTWGDYSTLVKKLKIELDKKSTRLDVHKRTFDEDFSVSEKVQLLHLLVRIALVDGVLAQSEERVLQEITAQLGVPYRTLDSLLAMYRFRKEQAENQQQQRTKTTSISQLENAYKILEIDAAATNQEIKKAYKKLAIIHHPDKVAHLGEHLQKNAAEKFKIIVGAYDLICKKRGIV